MIDKSKVLLLHAGDELDKLVSKYVFNIVKNNWDGEKLKPPSYSTSIISAWRVFEWLCESCSGGITIKHNEKPYEDYVWEIYGKNIISLKGDKLEELICKAAVIRSISIK